MKVPCFQCNENHDRVSRFCSEKCRSKWETEVIRSFAPFPKPYNGWKSDD